MTSVEVLNKEFAKVFRGYDCEAVDGFLEKLAKELDALEQDCSEQRRRAERLQQEIDSLRRDLSQREAGLSSDRARLEEELEGYRRMEKQLTEAIVEARQQRQKMLDEAAAEAARLREEADRQRKEAGAEAQRVVEEGRAAAAELLAEAEARLQDLTRRSEEAGRQLESLLSGYRRAREVVLGFQDKFRQLAAELQQAGDLLGIGEEAPRGVVNFDEYKKVPRRLGN